MRESSVFHLPKENTSEKLSDNYDRGHELGSGAFSVVYQAIRKSDGQKFACKEVAKDQTNIREMYAELEVQALLSHPNVVNFIECYDEKLNYCVLMEQITGGELFDRIIELRRYTEKDAAHVTSQALLGIQHMHQKHIVHRDLKPENLLLGSKELDATVKVADFGFSTKCRPDEELFETLGTPPYMAPEIVILRNEYDGTPGYGKPVDIWALGICVYILLSGVHPFQIEDEDQMLDNIEDGIWRWLGSNWAVISEEAHDLIKGMMEPDPEKRWTVEECLASDWIAGHAPEEDLIAIKRELAEYQAKKRLKGAIFSVMASNKMSALLAASMNKNKAGGGSGGASSSGGDSSPATQKENKKNAKIVTERKRPTKLSKTDYDTLNLTIVNGKDLAAKDSNGKSDPYVRVWCGSFKYKSKTIKKTLDPTWNEVVHIPSALCGNPITLEVWDWDFVGGDDYMGEITFVTGDLALGEHTLMLSKPSKRSKKKSGSISGSITFILSKGAL